jgi:hypothetical protein
MELLNVLNFVYRPIFWKPENTAFRKQDLSPSSGEGGDINSVGPLSLDNTCRVESCRVLCYTDGQSASLSWNKTPIWGLRPDFYYCQTVADLLMWGALSEERTGLSFTTVAGLRQRSHSRVRVPWGSRPYFTILDSRLPFLSPPTTRRATVEVFDPISTQDSQQSLSA